MNFTALEITQLRADFESHFEGHRTLLASPDKRLVIMNHAKKSGYTIGLEVSADALILDEKENEGQLKARIQETATITAEVLKDCAGFAFLQSGQNATQAIFCKITGRHIPVGELFRIWTFFITPTNELVDIS